MAKDPKKDDVVDMVDDREVRVTDDELWGESDDDLDLDDDDQDDDADDESDDADDESDDADDDDADDDDADDDDADDDDDQPPAGKKPKGKKTVQDRIAEITAARRAAEKATFDAEMRALALERQLQQTAAPADEKPLVEPDPDKYEYGIVDDQYQKDLVDYRVAVELKKRQGDIAKQQTEQTEQQKLAHYKTRTDEVMTEGQKKHGDFAKIVGDVNFDPEVARLVLDSKMAVDIAYYLGNNIDTLLTITRMDSIGRAQAIGRLEGQLSVTSTVRKKSKAPKATKRKRGEAAPRKSHGKYGPASQDEFDKAFFGR